MANETVYPFGQGGSLPSGYPIADDLQTSSAQQALSAKQGVVLKSEVDKKTDKYVQTSFPVGLLSAAVGNYINATNNVWASSSNTKSFFVPINPGLTYRITAGTNNARVAILKSATDTTGTTPDYASGETALRTISAGAVFEFVAQEDAHFLSINNTLSNTVICPSSIIEIEEDNSVQCEIDELRGAFNEEVDYSTLEVLSTASSSIAITKDGEGGIVVQNKSQSSGKYALIALPSNLVHGKKYTISFSYDAFFSSADTWWMALVDSSYSPTSGGITLYPKFGQKATYNYTHAYGNTYLRLTSYSQNVGAFVYIRNFSISENKTTVANLSSRVIELETNGTGGGKDDMDNLITQARYIASSPTVSPLVLLHFTDIHGDSVAASQILSFYEKYKTKIDDMVLTGDAVYYYYNSTGQGYQWYKDVGLDDALFVLGNHDGAANDDSHGWKEGSADWDFKGKEWDFDTYFSDYISSRGVTPPTGYNDSSSPYYKACYWHKDYTDAKVRVIGLDCMHFNDGVRYTSNDQETWLAAKLQETLTSGNSAYGYGVVFLCHYPLDDFSGNNMTWDETTHRFICNQNEEGGAVIDNNTYNQVNFHNGSSYSAEAKFSMRNRVGTVGSTSYTKGDDNPIADVIQDWIDDGGKYIVWLSGHTHTDYMYYPAKYPDMLCVGLSQAGNTRGTNEADRSDSSAMHSSANLIVIDRMNSLFKIVRFGKTINKYFISQVSLCYSFTQKVVFRR